MLRKSISSRASCPGRGNSRFRISHRREGESGELNFISVEVITALAGLATGVGASSVITWLLNRYDRRHPVVDVDKLVRRIEELNEQIDLSTLADKLDALNNAVIELAYLRIRERHETAMRHGWMHPNEKHVLERLYHAYHSIGGNGVGTQMIEEIRDLPSIPPGGDSTSLMCEGRMETTNDND